MPTQASIQAPQPEKNHIGISTYPHDRKQHSPECVRLNVESFAARGYRPLAPQTPSSPTQWGKIGTGVPPLAHRWTWGRSLGFTYAAGGDHRPFSIVIAGPSSRARRGRPDDPEGTGSSPAMTRGETQGARFPLGMGCIARFEIPPFGGQAGTWSCVVSDSREVFWRRFGAPSQVMMRATFTL
jgi:hypothetical protein